MFASQINKVYSMCNIRCKIENCIIQMYVYVKVGQPKKDSLCTIMWT